MTFRYLILSLLIIVFLPSCKSKSPLEALKRGRLEELKEFHKSGDKLSDLINKNDTFLTYSIKNRLDDISLWLIKSNINDISTADSSGNTPIILSAIHKSKKVLKVLIKEKLDLNEFNSQGKNLISIIAEQGNYNYFIQLIEKYKVDIKFKVPYGIYDDYSIVEFAISGGNLDIIKYLKKRRFKFKAIKSNSNSKKCRCIYKD